MISQQEIIQKGYQALVDALGTVNTIRFIQHFSLGQGNYTEERHQWLDNLKPEEIFAQMENANRAALEKPLGRYDEIIE
jgi:hypothetical protein